MLRFFRLSSLMALLWLMGGCASNDDPTAGWTVEKLHAEAKDEMAAGAYEKAIGLYDKLEGRAAGTVLSQQAQLEKAFAQYKNNEPILAVDRLLAQLPPQKPVSAQWILACRPLVCTQSVKPQAHGTLSFW